METDEILLLLLLKKKFNTENNSCLKCSSVLNFMGRGAVAAFYFSEGSWSRVMTLEACMASRHQPSVIMELVLPCPP